MTMTTDPSGRPPGSNGLRRPIRRGLAFLSACHRVFRGACRAQAGRIFALLLLVVSIAAPLGGTGAATTWQWYKTDPHIHSSVSADAFVDLGIISQTAKANGYNAIFLTDHNGGSSFQINRLDANHMAFEDTYTRWEVGTYGSLSSTTNALATTPVNSGTSSLHLASRSSSYGETFVWTKRGPNFRSGDIILRVSIYPTRIDAGSGVYVSASIGGDPFVDSSPRGYTTAGGAISSGKTTVLVWQLGSARAPSSDPNARVLTYSLGSYQLNAWNTYTINVSQALNDIPPADRPLDYNGLTYLKMAAAGANGGTADAYFDTYSIDASTPSPPADEYVYRTGVIGPYDTSTFKLYPSYEMGQQKHSNRFNFGITQASEYVSYTYGSDGILTTQQSGYPAQLNHPGTTITEQDAIDGQGKGADFLEVRDPAWVDVWDAILQQGVQMIGSWSSDAHHGLSSGKAATYVYAPALDFDELLHSYFEGRVYNANSSFAGQATFNLSSTSAEPYPARYPVYVSDATTSADVHLGVSGGLSSGYTVRWIQDGTLIATDSASGSTYDATRSISLSRARTYVRAEVRSSSGSLRAMTQPIFFVDVPSLPAGWSYYVDRITTASGRHYTRISTKGMTTTNWNATSQDLLLTLENPVGSLTRIRAALDAAPTQVTVGGSLVAAAGSFGTFDGATGSSWYFDAAGQVLWFKASQLTAVTGVVVRFSGAPLPTSTPSATPMPPGTPTATPTATTAPTGVVLMPVADAYVDSSNSTTNYGGLMALRTDASPIVNSYLRFDLPGLSGPVTRATLRVYANSTSPVGYDVRGVADNTWSETGITYANAPAVSSVVTGSSGAIGAAGWTSVDVTSLVTGNGLRSLALTSTGSTAISLASRESGANAPQLIVESAVTSTAIPTSTPTAPSASPTASSTPLAATPTGTATSTPAPVLPTLTFPASEDTYVDASSPNTNYGSAAELAVDGSPRQVAYLKFEVTGLTGTVQSARVRVYVTDSSNSGGSIARTGASWSESTMTYDTGRPAIEGSVLTTLGSVSTGLYYEFNVDGSVTGDGTVSYSITSNSRNSVAYGSSESTHPPELVITTSA